MISKNTKEREKDKDVNINIDKTVDDLLKCWNSRIQFQNYMKQIDSQVLGGLDFERDKLVKSNEFLEGPEIRLRNDFGSISKKRYDDNTFRSSMGKKINDIRIKGDYEIKNKKMDANIQGSLNKLNDLLCNSNLNDNEESSKNQSIDSKMSNDVDWIDKSIKNNISKKK